MRILAFFLFAFYSLSGQTQHSLVDSTQYFRLKNINVTTTTANFQTSKPDYSNLSNNFSRGNTLQSFEDFTVDETQAFSSNYSGFKINFLFESSLLEKTRWLDFFAFSFETGVHRIDLFRLIQDDSSLIDYKMNNEAFRLTFGTRKILTKKNRRFRFFSGIDWVHEAHISSFLLEGDRRIFAKKKYSTYVNVPLGVEWRFNGKKNDFTKYKSVFFSLHFGTGFQKIDPYSLFGSYIGTTFGLSFSI